MPINTWAGKATPSGRAGLIDHFGYPSWVLPVVLGFLSAFPGGVLVSSVFCGFPRFSPVFPGFLPAFPGGVLVSSVFCGFPRFPRSGNRGNPQKHQMKPKPLREKPGGIRKTPGEPKKGSQSGRLDQRVLPYQTLGGPQGCPLGDPKGVPKMPQRGPKGALEGPQRRPKGDPRRL